MNSVFLIELIELVVVFCSESSGKADLTCIFNESDL